MTYMTEWNVDGHHIMAATREMAREECIALYDHDPEHIEEWGMA